MKRLVIAPYSKRLEDAVKAVGIDSESLTIAFSYERYSSGGYSNMVVLDSLNLAMAISTAIGYAKSFDRVRVVVAESPSPYPIIATLLTFTALATLEPLYSFNLEPLYIYHAGKLREFSGKPRLWIKDLRDLAILTTLRYSCMSCLEVSRRSSIPVETTRRRLYKLWRGGLLETSKSSRKTLYCLNDIGLMLTPQNLAI